MKSRLWALAFAVWIVAGVAAGPLYTTPPPGPRSPIPASPLTDRLESYEVYDGDTLTRCTIDLGYGVVLRDSVRIAGVDAPEVTGDHRDAGRVVARAASVWLGSHAELWLVGRGRDKYGRILGDVQPAGVGQSLSEWLIERGYAHPYDGKGPRPVWTQAELDAIANTQGASR